MRQPPGYRPRVRSRPAATVLIWAAAACLLISYGGPLWQATLLEGTSPAGPDWKVVVNFDLGGRIACMAYVSNLQPLCTPVAAAMTGLHGHVYSALDPLVAGMAGAGFFAGALGVLVTVGRTFGRVQLRLMIGVALGILIGSVAILIGVSILGPGPDAGPICLEFTNSFSTCPTFFGALTAPATGHRLLWGAGPAYFAIAAGGALSGISALLLLLTRKAPITRAETEAWSREHAPYLFQL